MSGHRFGRRSGQGSGQGSGTRVRVGLAALVLVGLAAACTGSSSSSGPGPATTDVAAAPAPTATPATPATITIVPGSTPAGDLAFLGPLHQVPVGDITVGFRQFGSGPPLVLIVGQDSTMGYWGSDLLRRLADHFTVTTFDNRGIGTTTDPATSPLTIGQMADDTAGFLDAVGLEHPTVFGWSTGGEIALALAVRHPGRLGPLMVSGATAGSPSSTPAPPELDALLAASDPASQVRLLDELFTPSGPVTTAAYVQDLLAMPDGTVTPAAEARQADAEAAFVRDSSVLDGLASITTPVLVTDGADDRLVPPANATLIAGRIPGAQLVLVPGTRHGWMIQQPDRFVDLLIAFSAGGPLPSSPGVARPG